MLIDSTMIMRSKTTSKQALDRFLNCLSACRYAPSKEELSRCYAENDGNSLNKAVAEVFKQNFGGYTMNENLKYFCKQFGINIIPSSDDEMETVKKVLVYESEIRRNL